MVEELEKELTEPVNLVNELSQIAPKIEEARNIIANIVRLDKEIRDAQQLAKGVPTPLGAVGLAKAYDTVLSIYNTLIKAIGKKYKIFANGVQKYIQPEDLTPYKSALNWLERKVRGWVITFKDELIELGYYILGLPKKYA